MAEVSPIKLIVTIFILGLLVFLGVMASLGNAASISILVGVSILSVFGLGFLVSNLQRHADAKREAVRTGTNLNKDQIETLTSSQELITERYKSLSAATRAQNLIQGPETQEQEEWCTIDEEMFQGYLQPKGD